MRREGVFLNELQFVSLAKNDGKKCKTWQSNVPSIVTNVRRLQTINRKATLVLDEGVQTKKKWKTGFQWVAVVAIVEQVKNHQKKTTIKRTWLSWIKSIRSKERMAYSLEEDKEKGTKQREDCEWSLYPPAFTYLSIMVVFFVSNSSGCFTPGNCATLFTDVHQVFLTIRLCILPWSLRGFLQMKVGYMASHCCFLQQTYWPNY